MAVPDLVIPLVGIVTDQPPVLEVLEHVTLVLLHHFPEQRQMGALLLPVLGVALLLTSAAMLFQRSLHELGQRLRTTKPDNFKQAQPGLTVVAGALLGFLASQELGAGLRSGLGRPTGR